MSTGGQPIKIDEALSIAKKAIELRRKGEAQYLVQEKLGRSWLTIKKYMELYQEGGKRAILKNIKETINSQKPKNRVKLIKDQHSNSRAILWGKEYSYSSLWNHALFGRSMSGIINDLGE